MEGDQEIRTSQKLIDANTNEVLLENDAATYTDDGMHFWNLAIRTSEGYTTSNNNIVYSFEVDMGDGKVMTHNYILGEKRHCVVQEVNVNDSDECKEAVKLLIDSFEWN